MNTPAKEAIIFRVAELFFQGLKAPEIARKINSEDPAPEVPLTREKVYPLLWQARDQGFIRLVAPLERQLADELTDRFVNVQREDIRVVNAEQPESNVQVAAAAADWAFELLQDLQRGDDPVTLGLGPGRASLDFSRCLGELMRAAERPPRLRLVSISAGSPTRRPEFAPTSFFNVFPKQSIEECIGLFAAPLVHSREFDAVKQTPEFQEVWTERERIQMVVTSMGDFRDEDDLLRMFLEQRDVRIEHLISRGYLGNVQYRPYQADGFVEEKPEEYRAVTLFELADFRDMARTKKKEVVLVARRCGRCGLTRARAIRPLLQRPDMKVWSKLVVDVGTARELLNDTA